MLSAILASKRTIKSIGVYDRVFPVHETLRLARALAPEYGITRICETTHLDNIGIPTMGAVVPRSGDCISVYSGKGITREHALTGALMEALERQILVRSGEDFEARELLGGNTVRLARSALGRTTNGLASGGNLLEAAYHAIFEVLERHVWSLVHLRAQVWPRFIRSAVRGAASHCVDDAQTLEIHVPTGNAVVDALAHKIQSAGLQLRLLATREPSLPVGMLACIRGLADDPWIYHLGLGCSWSPEHAAVRALTEVAQARTTRFQGAREDFFRGSAVHVADSHGRMPNREPVGRWFYDGAARCTISFSELPDESSRNLAEDLLKALDAMRVDENARVYAVDLTPPGCPISVVKVLIPHLEQTLADGSITSRLRLLLSNPFGAGTKQHGIVEAPVFERL